MVRNHTTKLFLVSSIALIAATIVTGVLWFQTYRSGMSLQEDMQLVANEKALANVYGKLEQTLEETTKQREQLQQYILEGQKDTIPLLSQFDTAAAARNVDLSTESLAVRVTEEPGFDELVATFSLEGTQRAVMDMLRLFEMLPQHGYVAKFSTSRSTNPTTGAASTNADITLVLSILEKT